MTVRRDVMSATSNAARASGIVLILLIGLLNFHIPHFLIERAPRSSYGAYLLELALLANVLGAVIAAVGIYLGWRWAWLLGVVIASISVALYVVQETVGLPGLPRMWLEPSRLLALLLEGLFLVLAVRQLVTPGRSTAGG
jgi:hypothetical protein